MPNGPRHTKKKWIGSLLLVTAIAAICMRFLDIPVALYVKNHIYRNAHWSRLTSDVPDLLVLLVLVTTLVACLLYFIRTRKSIYDDATSFVKLVAWTAPVSYFVKSGMKLIFGRVNTRCWLQEPDLYGFHWFRKIAGCDGFPSGHMIVIVALIATLWRFYPKCRSLCLVAVALLGLLLVATNYHFVSDVIAGAYVGVLVEAVVFRVLVRERCGAAAQRSVSPR